MLLSIKKFSLGWHMHSPITVLSMDRAVTDLFFRYAHLTLYTLGEFHCRLPSRKLFNIR